MATGAATAPVQTVVLRVSIHCHGCKKKVRKVLKSVEGVQSVTVDAAQHKVTVTGTVDANTLVQRLHKSGKKGVPWQYCHPPANKTEAAPAPEAAPPAQPAGDGGKDAAAKAADKKPEEAEAEPKAEKKAEAEPKAEKKVEAKKDGGDSEAAETKAKGAEPAKEEAKEAAAAAANAKNEDAAKKNDKPKDAGKPEPVAVTSERSLPQPAPPPPAPKYAYEEEYRYPYYAPAPQPVMSYHAAQPSASVSYFAPQPQAAYSAHQPQPQPMRQWSPSYLYVPYPHAAAEPYHQDYYSPPGMHASPPPMQDSYRIFDDENPNSCSVM
ncbi:hypothetical protein PVAP13_9NG584100 [Panicum virgatum]|uniref:HMA domain-containing protein n=1 Tax=Panicum virgatum TaxID=38727 RepID=A0A8T0MTM8_PANVG|nr:hypothetical protein PVAP13_9NG584100 [Panicum virgatum]